MRDIDIRYIGKQFGIEGDLNSFCCITNGNINLTYKADYEQGSYIFQRINPDVFENPIEIMENIEQVGKYIAKHFPDEMFLTFLNDEGGKNYYIDQDGFLWRACEYIDSVSYSKCDDLDVIESVGEAIGHFQRMLAVFPSDKLHETIVDFHNTRKRMEKLFVDAEIDALGRAKDVKSELDYLKSMQETASKTSIEYEQGRMPARVTHNDTKCDNVLFDKTTGLPITLIDLDTIMPGLAINDFADAVRSIANNGAEDEADLTKVFLDTAKYRALARGYLGQMKDVLTEKEIAAIPLAVLSIVLEQASRFLDDYLNGDTYFKINYPKHNLKRAQCHIQLAKDIVAKYDELLKITKF